MMGRQWGSGSESPQKKVILFQEKNKRFGIHQRNLKLIIQSG